jgi:hypothetical protein
MKEIFEDNLFHVNGKTITAKAGQLKVRQDAF